MSNKEMFKKYNTRLMVEGILKALLIGLVAGFAVGMIPAVISRWMITYNTLWIIMSAVTIVIVTGIVAVPVYLKWFKPTTKAVAARVDKLGLEERLITMMELEGDESYIAMLQREDAKEKAKSVGNKQVGFSFAKIFILPLVLMFVFSHLSVGVMIASAITDHEKMAWEAIDPPEVERPINPDDIDHGYCAVCCICECVCENEEECECEIEENCECECVFFTVRYGIQEDETFGFVGGVIYGYTEQVIHQGDDALSVVAVADPWFAFERWSDWPEIDPNDEEAEPYPLRQRHTRQDFEIGHDIDVYAIFVRVSEPPMGEGEGDGQDGEHNQDNEDEEEEREPQLPEPCTCCDCDIEWVGSFDGSIECECECTCPEPDPESDPNNVRWGDVNNVIDGRTHIREVMEQYYREAMATLAAGGDICPVHRAMIEAFFGIILVGAQ